MSTQEPGDRLARYFARDSTYWSGNQRAAFEMACELADVEPNINEAWHWKRERGAAFEAWRELSKSRRKAMLRESAA